MAAVLGYYDRAAIGFAEVVRRDPRGALLETIIMTVIAVAATVLAFVAVYKSERGEPIPLEMTVSIGFLLGFTITRAALTIIRISIAAKVLGA